MLGKIDLSEKNKISRSTQEELANSDTLEICIYWRKENISDSTLLITNIPHIYAIILVYIWLLSKVTIENMITTQG